MAKNTIGKTASDKALDNVMAAISKINSAERRGESLQAHQDLYKKKEHNITPRKTDLALSNFVATKRMRTKRKKVTAPIISVEEQLWIDRAIALNVPVEFLKKHPNLRPAKSVEVDLDKINMELMNQLLVTELNA